MLSTCQQFIIWKLSNMTQRSALLLSTLMLHMALTAAEIEPACTLSTQQLTDLENCCSKNYTRYNEQNTRCSSIYFHLMILNLYRYDSTMDCIKILKMKNCTENILRNNSSQSLRVVNMRKSMLDHGGLEIEFLINQNDTINKVNFIEMIYSNHVEILGILNDCSNKTNQAICNDIETQNILHTGSTYKHNNPSMSISYFKRLLEPLLTKSSLSGKKRNQSKSILNEVSKKCYNLIDKFKCNYFLFGFLIIHHSHYSITYNSIIVTNIKKHKIINESFQPCLIVFTIDMENNSKPTVDVEIMRSTPKMDNPKKVFTIFIVTYIIILFLWMCVTCILRLIQRVYRFICA